VNNEANRTLIVLVAALVMVLMAVLIFLAWAAPDDVIDTLQNAVNDLRDNNDTAGRMIVTLAALAIAVLSLLVIVVELAPEDEERELRVEQAGSTTIVPAQALRQRLEESLAAIRDVRAARARVFTQDKGIAARLDLTVANGANLASVTQDSSRVVIGTIQTELGLPVSGLPIVRISYGDGKRAPASAAPVASSTSATPQSLVTEPAEMLGDHADAPPDEPSVVDPLEGSAKDAQPEGPA